MFDVQGRLVGLVSRYPTAGAKVVLGPGVGRIYGLMKKAGISLGPGG
ncbi:MAG TPA: hypothetical protein V6D08_01155 [Candidatus Obscuribacterales bacterium]